MRFAPRSQNGMLRSPACLPAFCASFCFIDITKSILTDVKAYVFRNGVGRGDARDFGWCLFMDDMFNIMGDFDIRAARINVSGSVAVIDNVKKVIIMSDTNITVDHGKGQLALYGVGMNVEYIYDGRIRVNGKFSSIEFYGKNGGAEMRKEGRK